MYRSSFYSETNKRETKTPLARKEKNTNKQADADVNLFIYSSHPGDTIPKCLFTIPTFTWVRDWINTLFESYWFAAWLKCIPNTIEGDLLITTMICSFNPCRMFQFKWLGWNESSILLNTVIKEERRNPGSRVSVKNNAEMFWMEERANREEEEQWKEEAGRETEEKELRLIRDIFTLDMITIKTVNK